MYVHMAITMSKRRLKCNIYIETLQSVTEKVIGRLVGSHEEFSFHVIR